MKSILKFFFKRSINKYLECKRYGFNIYSISQFNEWSLRYTRLIERLVNYLKLK